DDQSAAEPPARPYCHTANGFWRRRLAPRARGASRSVSACEGHLFLSVPERDRSERRDRDRNRGVIERAAAQLAGVVAAPAVSGPGPREPTSVAQGPGEGAEAQPAGDRDRNRTIGGRAVAQLAVDVGAPAVRRPGAGKAARVRPPRSEGAEAQPPGDRHRNRPVGARPVAQFAIVIVAPAETCPATGQPAGVSVE